MSMCLRDRVIRLAPLFIGLLIFAGASLHVRAQSAEEELFPEHKKDDTPRAIQDSLAQMRIDRQKKDYNEMLKRGDDAVKVAADLKPESLANQREQIVALGKL